MRGKQAFVLWINQLKRYGCRVEAARSLPVGCLNPTAQLLVVYLISSLELLPASSMGVREVADQAFDNSARVPHTSSLVINP
jgi:hypothetical protein